ncbi:Bug family tripartite tricarboxylate transporter substrate binding protein [Janibacter sp. GS2]|uniref:Bug family tripartite tricarboxylate transporter substrate binding protein n=1 Tax=Janibacter sp. GS2 TaxID=3442646 RepID=UPI003EB8FE8C
MTHRSGTTLDRMRRATVVAMMCCCLLIACSTDVRHPDVPMRVLVPNATGGGYDTTARVMAAAVDEEEIAERPEVFNLEGGGGSAGLARIVHERGNDQLLLMMGLGVVGAVHSQDTTVRLDQATPIARLLTEPEVVVVHAKNGARSLDDLVQEWRDDPQQVVVGGGSSPGGPDHLAAYAIAEEVGIPVKEVQYEQYDGGGPLLAALLGGDIDVAVTGVLETADQVRAGSVRTLALTSATSIPGMKAPTMRELGYDVEFANWRGVMAPPGLPQAQRSRLIDLVREMRATSTWKAAARQHGWTDALLTGEEFGEFLEEEDQRVATLLSELGSAR